MNGRPSGIGRSAPGLSQRYRWSLITMLVLLAIQFLIGMTTNLFVTVPDSHPGSNAPEYFSGVAQGIVWALGTSALVLRIHVVIGLVVFLIALWLLGLAIVASRRGWIIITAVGLLGIMAAGFNGASFMNYGHDFSSLLMSIGFLIATVAYVVGYLV
jgi:hypothetical protein